MHPKVVELRRLIAEGYTVEGITSDASRIDAQLAGARNARVIITFDRHDALRLLFEDGALGPGIVRVRPRSRWLVTGPLG